MARIGTRGWFGAHLPLPQANVGSFTGAFSAMIASHDIGIYVLTPGQC